jgi:phosphoribosylaminoimidazole-succinocarboxamide synthase
MNELGLTPLYSGKVRDLYAVGDRHLLMVASDRLSAFDVVMAESIPEKGRVLTGMTNFWIHEFGESVPTSLVSCDPAVIEQSVPGFLAQTQWHGRAMLVRKADMLPIECIVRGRLAGSAHEEYVARGTVHEMIVPPGLKLTDGFAEPMFTPATKATSGHDVNISVERAALLVGAERVHHAQTLCVELFTRAAALLATKGLILADTKFELGFVDGELVLCDEVITFDKQPLRDWLSAQPWDRTPPPPTIPDDVVAITSARYVDAYERVTGTSLSDWYGASQ